MEAITIPPSLFKKNVGITMKQNNIITVLERTAADATRVWGYILPGKIFALDSDVTVVTIQTKMFSPRGGFLTNSIETIKSNKHTVMKQRKWLQVIGVLCLKLLMW